MLFFPAEIAVALTAVVHLLNNLFKLYLVGKFADKSVVLKFGIPAIIAAYLGAKALLSLAEMQSLYHFELFSQTFSVMPVNLAIGVMMMLFAALELIPDAKNFSLEKKYLPLGGVLSGFFGGLSGHQGALRSMFLLRAGLDKKAFIATGVVIACFIDLSRLFVYSERFTPANLNENAGILIAATVTAFIGAYIGKQLMEKVTMRGVQVTVSIMLILLGIGLSIGIL